MSRPVGGVVPDKKIYRNACLTAFHMKFWMSLQNGAQADDTKEFVVPEGNYFFMGDNRDNSVRIAD
jgi:hypothetical protein